MVRARGYRDDVLARRVDGDHRQTGWGAGIPGDGGCVVAFVLQGGCEARAEVILTYAAGHADVRTQPGRGDRLVSTLAARSEARAPAEHGHAGAGQYRHRDRDVHIEAAEHGHPRSAVHARTLARSRVRAFARSPATRLFAATFGAVFAEESSLAEKMESFLTPFLPLGMDVPAKGRLGEGDGEFLRGGYGGGDCRTGGWGRGRGSSYEGVRGSEIAEPGRAGGRSLR